jgi:hypothetical protein
MRPTLSKIRRQIVRFASTPTGRFTLVIALLLACGANDATAQLAAVAWAVATWTPSPPAPRSP